MRPRFINELAEGVKVSADYVVHAKELRHARNGEPYLWMVVGDRTGSIPLVWFNPSGTAVDVPAGAVVTVSASVTSYQGRRRLRAESIAPAATWEPGDFIAVGPRSAEQLRDCLRAEVRAIKSKELRAFVSRLFSRDDVLERFIACPATVSSHRAYLGGLAEHTLSVLDLARAAARRYPNVDEDLLAAAALVHDVGRVWEIEFDTSIGLSDRGRLLGHVALGASAVSEAAGIVGLDPLRAAALQHALLSHHGGDGVASVAPSTIEAMVLHHADHMDCQVGAFASAVTPSLRAGESWSGGDNPFGRALYAAAPTPDAVAADSHLGRLSA